MSYVVKDASELNSIMNKAFEVAMDGKRGAVHIDIPKDIQTTEIELDSDLLK